jgi:hypothetical protein
MPIPDFQTYSAFVHALQQRYARIQRSTLVLATIGSTLAKLEGQVIFEGNVILDIWELIDFAAGRIRNYSYEIYLADEKIAWYDPFEHPHIAELASTYPHHKHIFPDLKHHRVPAPGISFEQLNLPTLIEAIQRDMLPASPP